MPLAGVIGAGLTVLLTLSCGGSVDGDGQPESGDMAGAGGAEGTPTGGTAGDGGRATGGEGVGSVTPRVVVDLAWLDGAFDTNIQFIDARGEPTGGHIPGAVPLNPILLMDSSDSISGQVMQPSEAEGVLRSLGLRNDAIFVVYGGPPEYDPARAVWALRYYGHEETYYLDGGFPAWVADGREVASGTPSADEPSNYTMGPANDAIRVESDYVLSSLGDAPYDGVTIQLVDARSAEEWNAGRILTATHVPWTDVLSGGLLLDDSGLRERYDRLDPAVTTVAYCLVGWRASVAWLSLTELGFSDVRVYDGSWQEWGAEGASFPIEK